MGQVLNRVTCPACNYTSRNFDPFNMLSIPFPTVSDVVFKCQVLRRASPYNCSKTLGLKAADRQSSWQNKPVHPPSEQLILEEYIITLSRLADIGDLKEKLHELCGISSNRLKLFVLDEHDEDDEEDSPSQSSDTVHLTALPEKEGPCLQFARQSTTGEFLSPSEVPTTIIVFESTLKYRPTDNSETQDESEEPAYDLASANKIQQLRKNAQEDLKLYGDSNECRVFDTDSTKLARWMSRCLWPESSKDVVLGLRVDAIDHRGHWFPGSVVDVTSVRDESAKAEDDKTKIKVHFDNFSAKWDLTYTFTDFTKGNVQPLFSHSHPKDTPLEFQVFHSAVDKPTILFGYPFLLQCCSEWSVARAGAQILAQASRFLERPPGIIIDMKDIEMTKIYRDSRNVISTAIDLLIEADRNYVNAAFSPSNGAEHHFGSLIIESLEKKLMSIFSKLPFDLLICDTTQPSEEDHESDKIFEFRLDRTIGNYMNARHGVVLQWKSFGRSEKLTLYTEPIIAVVQQHTKTKDKGKRDSDEAKGKYAHGGMRLGVCLDEFCKEQNLEQDDCWRCPKCKDVREGRQSMSLWRLPDLLTFHLKRFNCSARWREKITTKINFPLTGLDMTEWCDKESPCSSEGGYIYDLVGVVNHYGGMTGGHYVATCKVTACSPEGSEEVEHNFNGAGVHAFGAQEKVTQTATWKLGKKKEKDSTGIHTRAALSAAKTAAESSEPLWLQFDDDSVEPIPPRTVNTESAYVLFYRRRQLSPSNIARYSTMD